MSLPIPVSTFAEYLPHQPPMVWVDEIVAIDDEGGTCRLTLRDGAPYLDKTGKFRQTSLIECMAQSYGFLRAAQIGLGLTETVEIPEVAFLAQIRKAEFLNQDADFDVLFIELKRVKELGPLALAKAKAYTENQVELANAELKLFAR